MYVFSTYIHCLLNFILYILYTRISNVVIQFTKFYFIDTVYTYIGRSYTVNKEEFKSRR